MFQYYVEILALENIEVNYNRLKSPIFKTSNGLFDDSESLEIFFKKKNLLVFA